jgi:hypothetical protein
MKFVLQNIDSLGDFIEFPKTKNVEKTRIPINRR